MLVRIWRNWNPQILQGGNVKWYSLCEQQTVDSNKQNPQNYTYVYIQKNWKQYSNYNKPRQRIKKQRHYFANRGLYSQSYGFPVVMYKMWELDHKEDWTQNWSFRTIMLEKTLESPLDSKRSNQSILKEINSEYSLEGLMLKLKPQYFGHLKSQLIGKDPDAGKDWRQEEKGVSEDEMIGWHHRLNGHEFGHAPGDNEGQGRLVCCSPWGCKELDTT